MIRDERVLPDDTGGCKQLQRTEGERVSAGGTVALVYADQAAWTCQEQIQTLETQIEQLQYAEEAALGAEVSLRLDTQILQSILDYRRALAEDRLDRRRTTGRSCGAWCSSGTTPTPTRRTCPLSWRSCRASGRPAGPGGRSTRRITAPEAGLYSAVVDGYETVLTPEALEELTPGRLAGWSRMRRPRRNQRGKAGAGGRLVLRGGGGRGDGPDPGGERRS